MGESILSIAHKLVTSPLKSKIIQVSGLADAAITYLCGKN
jgi:hypothetical protein